MEISKPPSLSESSTVLGPKRFGLDASFDHLTTTIARMQNIYIKRYLWWWNFWTIKWPLGNGAKNGQYSSRVGFEYSSDNIIKMDPISIPTISTPYPCYKGTPRRCMVATMRFFALFMASSVLGESYVFNQIDFISEILSIDWSSFEQVKLILDQREMWFKKFL